MFGKIPQFGDNGAAMADNIHKCFMACDSCGIMLFLLRKTPAVYMILCANYVRLFSIALHRLWIIDLHIVCKIMQESFGSEWTASTLDIMCDPPQKKS